MEMTIYGAWRTADLAAGFGKQEIGQIQ